MPDPHATGSRAAMFESDWHLDTPIKYPTLRQLWREWRCGRKHGHGPHGFYYPHAIKGTPDFNVWLQECQACGRFTVWSERRNHA